jgi:N-acyl-L-homoserine lactone synthetase
MVMRQEGDPCSRRSAMLHRPFLVRVVLRSEKRAGNHRWWKPKDCRSQKEVVSSALNSHFSEMLMTSAAETLSKRAERASAVLDRTSYRLVQTDQEREEIYRLRYNAYRKEGVIDESSDRLVTDHYDDLPNSWIFGVYWDGELYGSIRINVLSREWRSSCAADFYAEIVHPLLDRGQVIVDPARFVADPYRERRVRELPYLTTRLAFMACAYFSAHTCFALVRKEHQPFYHRMFLHRTIAEPKAFPGLLRPFGLMAMDYPSVCHQVFERHPVLVSTEAEQRALFKR